MRYEFAPDIQKKAEKISKTLFSYIKIENIKCFRSIGTSSKRTIARCHALSKILQKAIKKEPFYVLEFLSERFDKLNEDEKIKVIIHELMHIPKSFGGGFRHHDFVCDKNVNKYFKKFQKKENENQNRK